jgi:SAM-dependent methyltransferase
MRVLELGCGTGDLLAALRPARGVGVDFAPEMVRLASTRHPGLAFVQGDASRLELGEEFDYVILSDVVNELWDVQAVLGRAALHCAPGARVVLNAYSRLWEVPLALARRAGLATPVLQQNWLTGEDIADLLEAAGLEPLRHQREILLPVRVPGVDGLCNRVLVKLPFFRHLALTNVFVARPRPTDARGRSRPLVSVVVPARNEAGTIEAIFERTPELGGGTELLFVEGHSTDGTADAIAREIARHPERTARLLRQTGEGKGDAVRLAFAEARGAVLVVLDADLTVSPEELPRFVDALLSGRGDFVNGVRFVYPMDHGAMPFLNMIVNKVFAMAFTALLGQPIKDALCGTKVLWRRDYERIAANRGFFGDFDPFGDFDLLFGAARQTLRILDLPVRYRARTYGRTNIKRLRHGLLLLRMLAVAARRLKFV